MSKAALLAGAAVAIGALALAGPAGREARGPARTRAAPPAAPAPRGMIAFHADPGGRDDLYAVRPDGSGLRALTNGMEQVPWARWAPDGRRLAFLARPGGTSDVYVVRANGAALRRLTDGPGDHYDLAWSPGGRTLAYACCGEEATAIHAVDVRSGRSRRLVGRAAQPAYSPDGRRLALTSFRRGNADIAVARADGSRPRRVTSGRWEDADPAWSPDGRLLAFDSKRTGRSQVYVARPDGSGLRRVSHDRFHDAEPAFSPDGATVLFVSYRNRDPLLRGIGDAEVLTADLRTGRVHDLTRTPAWEGDAAWSPDGRFIAFAVRSDFGPTGTFSLEIMDRSGGHRRRLPAPSADGGRAANACCPVWSRGG